MADSDAVKAYPKRARAVRTRPKPDKSVIETARNLRRELESGKAKTQAELTRKMGLSRARMT